MKFLTQKEFSKIFGISVKTVEGLRNSGKINYVKLETQYSSYYSSPIRIPEEEVEKYIKICKKFTNSKK